MLAVIAGGFGVLMGASPLLQAVRAHRRRSAEDVSLAFLTILWCGGGRSRPPSVAKALSSARTDMTARHLTVPTGLGVAPASAGGV